MNIAGTPKPQATHTAPAHVVHFGAGTCSELEYYLQSGAEQITLVEADSSTCKRLRQRVNGYQHVKVINAAIAAASAGATLFVYNFPAANSLRKATGLYDIFPGLRLKTEIPVTTTSPEDLLQPLGLDRKQTNWLTIDTPGEELPILEAMHDAGQLDYFNLLNVYCRTGNYYQDSTDAHTLLQQLQGWGFEVVLQDSQQDPDRPSWILQRNPLFPELTVAKEKLRELRQELDEANKARAEYEQQVLELRQLGAGEIETLRKLQAKYKQLDAKNQELSELKIKNRQLMKENDDIQARQKVIEEELGKAEAQIDLIQELLLNEDKAEKSQ